MKESDNPAVIAPPPLIALAAIGLGLLLDWLLPSYLLMVLLPWPTRIVIALTLGAAALALAIPSHLAFFRAGTPLEPWKPSIVLVTGSIFRWVRNPMYVGLILFLTGLSILLASDWMLTATVLFSAVLHVGVVRREERYLEAKFDDAYRRYKAEVPRYGWPG